MLVNIYSWETEIAVYLSPYSTQMCKFFHPGVARSVVLSAPAGCVISGSHQRDVSGAHARQAERGHQAGDVRVFDVVIERAS